MSESLFPKIHHFDYVQSFDSSITSIILPDWCCNERDCTVFDFSRFSLVESIEIGNHCFESVQSFQIDGLNGLKTLKIGNNSFTKLNMVVWGSVSFEETINFCDKSKSFHILNCESLESIEIGEYSFSDYAGEFELENLPQLQSIQIGTIGYYSANFYCSSFVIRGIELILDILMIRSSKSTIRYIR